MKINVFEDQKRGFTLIELLVVISIIALLLSILIPATSSVRNNARTTFCKSNCRQIGTLFEMYCGDHGDKGCWRFNGGRWTDLELSQTDPNSPDSSRWINNLTPDPYFGPTTNSDCDQPAYWGTAYAGHPDSWKGLRELWQCPSVGVTDGANTGDFAYASCFNDSSETQMLNGENYSSYGYNGYGIAAGQWSPRGQEWLNPGEHERYFRGGARRWSALFKIERVQVNMTGEFTGNEYTAEGYPQPVGNVKLRYPGQTILFHDSYETFIDGNGDTAIDYSIDPGEENHGIGDDQYGNAGGEWFDIHREYFRHGKNSTCNGLFMDLSVKDIAIGEFKYRWYTGMPLPESDQDLGPEWQ